MISNLKSEKQGCDYQNTFGGQVMGSRAKAEVKEKGKESSWRGADQLEHSALFYQMGKSKGQQAGLKRFKGGSSRKGYKGFGQVGHGEGQGPNQAWEAWEGVRRGMHRFGPENCKSVVRSTRRASTGAFGERRGTRPRRKSSICWRITMRRRWTVRRSAQ